MHFSYIALNINDCRPMSITSVFHMRNEAAELSIDPSGGAITRFALDKQGINPLSFAFAADHMPVNNQGGAVYQGHFACIGRWGEAAEGEKKRGVPNHGEPANSLWKVEEVNGLFVNMNITAIKEGLEVKRIVRLDEKLPVILVKETVTNIKTTGSPFNMVQHPTIAAPFLDNDTIIDCNGSIGFDQAHYKNIRGNSVYWNQAEMTGLRKQQMNNNAVYSFIVNKLDEYGWITAYSPTHKMLIGYVWKRKDYPWIHHWQHFNEEGIQYRGIEFGTAGIHQPFNEIIFTAASLFEEKTLEWLDADESTSKSFYGFMHKAETIGGIKSVTVKEDTIIVLPNEGEAIILNLSNELANGLFK